MQDIQRMKTTPVRQFTKQQLQQQLQEALKRQQMGKQVADWLENALEQTAMVKDHQIALLQQENLSLIEQSKQKESMIELLTHSHRQQVFRLRQQISEKNRTIQCSAIQKDRLKIAYQQTIAEIEQQIALKSQKLNHYQAKIHRLTMQRLQSQGQHTIRATNNHHSYILGELANSTLRYGQQNLNSSNIGYLNISKVADRDRLRRQKFDSYSRMSKQEIRVSVKAIKEAERQASRRQTSQLFVPEKDLSRQINRTHFI